MKVDNGSAAGAAAQVAQPAVPAAPAPAAPVPVESAPKEDFSARQNAYMGRRESFASKPSVPAITNVVAGGNYAYSPVTAGANPAAQLNAVGPAKPAAPTRTELLNDMTKDIKDPKQRKQIDTAAEAYSDNQLRQMRDMGLRFKMGDGMPTDRSDGHPAKIDRVDKDGRLVKAEGVYRSDKRTIQLKPTADSDEIRHELAHAWDDAKNEAPDPMPTRDTNPQWLKDGKTEALQQKHAADQAVSLRAQAKAYGPPRDAALNAEAEKLEKKAGYWKPGFASSDKNMVDAYTAYLKRTDKVGTDGKPQVSDKVFDSAASPGHSQKNVQEFYAEGYTTFHGGEGAEAQKARLKMREHAPELYEMLKEEARREGLPTPSEPPLRKPPGGDPLALD